MIRLSSHHSFEYMAASGALAFDGNGWPWEQPLRWVKLLDPKRFTIVLKTVTYGRRKGNLRRFRLFRTVRFLDEKGNSDFRTWWHPEGTVNAVGLTNPGIEYWCQKIAPQVEKSRYHVIASVASDDIAELQEMAQMLDGRYNLKGLEINASCPNTESELLENAGHVIDAVWAVAEILRMPLILKLSTTHDYLKIERETRGLIRAISINSVPWNIVFPQKKSPLENLGGRRRIGKACTAPYLEDA